MTVGVAGQLCKKPAGSADTTFSLLCLEVEIAKRKLKETRTVFGRWLWIGRCLLLQWKVYLLFASLSTSSLHCSNVSHSHILRVTSLPVSGRPGNALILANTRVSSLSWIVSCSYSSWRLCSFSQMCWKAPKKGWGRWRGPNHALRFHINFSNPNVSVISLVKW